jgi:hypothetical protein
MLSALTSAIASALLPKQFVVKSQGCLDDDDDAATCRKKPSIHDGG